MKNFTRVMLMFLLSSAFMIAQLSAQSILCVDNDLNEISVDFTDCWPMYQAALDANGLSYDYMQVDTVTYDGPDASVMEPYDIVIWWTGEIWQNSMTLTMNDEFNINLYQSISGGHVFFCGQDYLWDRYPSAGGFTSTEFPNYGFGLVNVVQDHWHIETDPDTARFNGAPGSIAEGLSFPVFDIFTETGSKDGLYADSIAEHLGTSLFTVVQPYISTGTPGIQYEGANFRVIFSTLSFAAITNQEAANEFMRRIISWLQYGGGLGTNDMTIEKHEILILPNPAKDYVNIGMLDKMQEVRLVNSQGQVVYYQNLNSIKTRIDVSQLPAGIYIVQAITAKGQATSRLVVE